MNNELTVKIGSQNHKVFLQSGFYSPSLLSTPLHKHNYTEIHVISNGTVDFRIGDCLHSTNDKNLIIIPRGVYHCFTANDKNVLHAAFQIDCDISEFSMYNICADTTLDFFHEIEECRATQNYTKISAYISLFCCHFYPGKNISAQPIADYGFLIREFFSTHYNKNIYLRDLADTLHLSERQTERLVIEHTGNTFTEELIAMRINIAKNLMKSSDMSLSKISQYVGYRSYAGFWKALKKYNSDNQL